MENRKFRCSDDEKFSKQVDKVIQLHETMLTRHTTMVVGPTGGGKSVIIDSLKNALGAAEDSKVSIYVLNPKMMTVNELYGVLDPSTRDWTDGLLSKLFRIMNNTPVPEGKKERRWILYDGDVDPIWVENMNSVMDDNKLLTLPNGERIRLEKFCAMLFEVYNIKHASPATVSRCGMVWVDDKDLGWKPYYEWWAKIKEENVEGLTEALMVLYDRFVDKSVKFILEGVDGDEVGVTLKNATPRTGLNMVKQLCTMIDLLLPKENPPSEADLLENLFVFCLIWSLGGTLVDSDRDKYQEFIKRMAERTLPPNIYDFFYDRATKQFFPWKQKVDAKGFELPTDKKFSKILVPTVDTERYSWLLSELIGSGQQCIFVGESGTAKTVTVSAYLTSLDSAKFQQLNINFSSRTTAADAMRTLEDKIEKRQGKQYGPPAGMKLICFIDDLHMPRMDKYGTQQPLALFKFLIEKGFFYNRQTLEDKIVKDTVYVGALQPPGGGRNEVDSRFMSLFCCFNVTFPSEENLQHIYNSILRKFLIGFSDEIAAISENVTLMTLKLYRDILEQLPRTPVKFHYIFNLRDLSRTYEGMYQSTFEKFSSVPQVLKLWRNEAVRVFADRLINAADRTKAVDELIAGLLRKTFPDHAEYALQEPLLYGDFLLTDPSDKEKEDPRLYEDLESFEQVSSRFSKFLKDYNEEMKPMNLVLFNYALDHLTRIHRIMRMATLC